MQTARSTRLICIIEVQRWTKLPPASFHAFLNNGSVLGWDRGHTTLTVNRAHLKQLISDLLNCVELDEGWYINAYPDVAAALAAGDILSARAHFINFGYFEGRLPSITFFDAAAYAEANPDVEARLGRNDEQLLSHFLKHGYSEGRPLRPQKARLSEAE